MNLYIIRHGESKWNIENRIQGSSDPGLSKLGRLQAKLLAGRFRKIKIDRIYSSPLLRSMQTARELSKVCRGAARRAPTITKIDDLREVMLGEWEEKTPQEIDKLYNNKYQEWLRYGPTRIRIPGQEKISNFRKRAQKAFRGIIKENRNRENVIVVTHGGVISSYLAGLLGADFDKMILKLHLPNTCVTLVSFEKERGCIRHIACVKHDRYKRFVKRGADKGTQRP